MRPRVNAFFPIDPINSPMRIVNSIHLPSKNVDRNHRQIGFDECISPWSLYFIARQTNEHETKFPAKQKIGKKVSRRKQTIGPLEVLPKCGELCESKKKLKPKSISAEFSLDHLLRKR